MDDFHLCICQFREHYDERYDFTGLFENKDPMLHAIAQTCSKVSSRAWPGAAGTSKIGAMKIREAVIVDAVRTPLGRRDGVLKSWHPVDLLAHTLRGLTDRNKLDPAIIDDVICGCVMQVGEQGINVGRNAVLAAGFPESVPATTVDRQCGSSQQAIHFAAQGVIAGSYEVAIACGVESMTRVPMGASIASGPGKPFGLAVMKRYNNSHFNQGISAEMMAERWKLNRASLDAYSLESHKRAARATDEGRFGRQVLPISVVTESGAQGDYTG